eukprot:scaffold7831_cov108-Isochrysis_galbana.AAC.9
MSVAPSAPAPCVVGACSDMARGTPARAKLARASSCAPSSIATPPPPVSNTAATRPAGVHAAPTIGPGADWPSIGQQGSRSIPPPLGTRARTEPLVPLREKTISTRSSPTQLMLKGRSPSGLPV